MTILLEHSLSLAIMESNYLKRVESLALLDPSLNRVLQYINRPPTQGSLDHKSIHAVLFDHANQGAWHTFEGAGSSLEQLGRVIRFTSSARTTVIVRDLQPAAMLYLGALLDINPVCFEHYLNRDASFDTFDSAVLVFDYPETLLYEGSNQTALEGTLPKASEGHGRGTLAKIWMNLYAYSQRVVSARISRSPSQSDIHLLLTDSLPKYSPLTYHLAAKSSAMWPNPRLEPASSDALANLQRLMMRPDPGQEPGAEALIDYVSSKWQTLLYYAQVKISESKAPLTGDIHLIAEVIQRKHDFEKLQRTLMANLGSSARLLLLPGMEPDNSSSKRLADLRAYEATIAGWASQLEKVASSLQGLLAISESLKAGQQASRTQNLTILAFVFIPVSTVSSIYGMNTVEIAQNNPRMWQFGVSASATTLVAIFAAWSYKYWCHFPMLVSSSLRRSPRKLEVVSAQSAPIGPARQSLRPVDQVTGARIHAAQPMSAISQNPSVVATGTSVQTTPLGVKPTHIGFRAEESDVEDGRLINGSGVHAFRMHEPIPNSNSSACIVM